MSGERASAAAVPHRAEIVVDLAAIRHNVRRLRALTRTPDGGGPLMMTVVKADGYGHGMVPVARAAREAGADWLGVATLDEAVALRDGHDRGRVLCWMAVPGEEYAPAIERDIDVSAYSLAQLAEIEQAAVEQGTTARVQLKVDTGLSRGGCLPVDWPALVDAARSAEERGAVRITGLWSHLACADDPAHPANDEQERVFLDAIEAARGAGLRPEVRHLANSAAAVLRPSSHFDMVRVGIASYGLDPAPGATGDLGLVPAMTVRATLAMVKRVEAGASVSYGHRWTAPAPTTLGLVPAGYAEGLPRAASNRGNVWAAGSRRPIRGTLCMDQFVIDLGDDTAAAGDTVEIFGTGHDGAPTAQEWAEVVDTINYEIVTRVGGRLARVHVDSETAATAREDDQ
ncbi:alanine racemase [Nocardioides sp. AE5]|uniref:alanine racemase n=1 Tax=Nocardioides sp. AE5 TaxID=2962573 RepID=UPI0028812FE0|nr:alanine racemase [Nocardioides sp. AE5]MDT0202058.1 alanine racemase [Nocardioides sp. AE5]